ncbi:hypothetical protein CQW49_15245 [Methylosinus trichosporium OB3b]|uniref:Uncharacterized protein n=1 Tax=Methylosinus trichosporium (strain ATCC 35070 / NCIMB 11131 / UNIQEM 75 / OB3b) TaxID=595536 RepID=A0A2D2D247_METT3|nr:hypothetical protein CQW49_15245 [Methylosinus trichosporium OB3b]OBS51896.1 hypothetical protein A8B73_13800 [Methylosinus sp. 3S-1]
MRTSIRIFARTLYYCVQSIVELWIVCIINLGWDAELLVCPPRLLDLFSVTASCNASSSVLRLSLGDG